MRFFMTILGILLPCAYFAICAYLWARQDQLLFFPRALPAAELSALGASQGYEPWLHPLDGSIGWKPQRAHFPTPTPADILLICQGNGGFALGDGYRPLREHPGAAIAFDTYLLEYPGYGARLGKPSAQSLTAAAIQAVDTLAAANAPSRRIFLLGQSLGSGVVCAAAAARPEKIAGIILVTPYDSLAAGAAAHYPWLPAGLLLRHRLDSIANLACYHGPVAFLLAGRDLTIPPRLGRRLYDAYAGPKKLWLAPAAGHNDLGQILAPWAEITAWLTAPHTSS